MALWKQSDDDFISQKRKEKNTYQKPKSAYTKAQNSKQTDIDIDKLYGYKEKVQTGKGKYIFLIAFVAIFMFGMFKPMIGSQLKINKSDNSDTGGYTYITSGFELKSDVYLVDNSYLLFLYSYPTIIYSSEKDPLDVYENHYALIENDSTNKETQALSCFSGHYLNLKEATSESRKDYDKIWKILDYNGSYRARIKMLDEEQSQETLG